MQTIKEISSDHNCIIGSNTEIGSGFNIGYNCIIESNVVIGDNVFIDSNTIIRSGVKIGSGSFIGSNCILGEHLSDFYVERENNKHVLLVGSNSLIRSGSIIYGESTIGANFQTGHRVTIRENSQIGNNVSVGTLSDIQGNCIIGDYVRIHSNAHIGQLSKIDSFVWIYPYVVLTNDPTPPSNDFVGVHVHSFAIIATGSIIMPGIDIGQDSLIGAGSIVTKPVTPYAVVVGNPAKAISDVRKIRNKLTGKSVYPWRYHFDSYMPWKDKGFQEWYESLDNYEKEKYFNNVIIEEVLENE